MSFPDSTATQYRLKSNSSLILRLAAEDCSSATTDSLTTRTYLKRMDSFVAGGVANAPLAIYLLLFFFFAEPWKATVINLILAQAETDRGVHRASCSRWAK